MKNKKPPTAIDLYKFIHDKGLEYHWDYQVPRNVYLFVPLFLIDDFMKIIKNGIDDETGEECIVKPDYFCFPNMVDFCDCLGIDPKEVFDPKGSHH